MKKLIATTLFLLFGAALNVCFSAVGDTTRVKVYDKFSMPRYGNFDAWGVFPAAGKPHQRIWMKLTLGCESAGQCEWDYTLKIAARQKAGRIDSTLKQAPSFRVNGQVKDSVMYHTDTTYTSFFNPVTKTGDSTATAQIHIIRYQDPMNPTVATDSMRVWPDGFYRFTYDSTGKKTDSVWSFKGAKIKLVNTPYYDKFEVINNYELARMITPYAKFFPKTFQYEYLYDVTDFSTLLHDSAQIRIIYEGYTYGFTSTVEFYFVEGTPAREAYKIENIYTGYFPYGKTADPIENYLKEKTIAIDANAVSTKLRITVTGHGGEGNENCAEFCKKNYYLKINDQVIAEQAVWKDNCGANPIINQGGTWIYNRANWCPGELVKVYEYPLNVSAGSNMKIDINMDPFTANGSAGYGYEVQLVSYKANSRVLDAGFEKVISPTDDFWQSKRNPMCDDGAVIVKNFGTTTVTSMELSCKIGNAAPVMVNWSGSIAAGEEKEVELPNLNWGGDNTNRTFKATITKVNGVADENAYNNEIGSKFNLPEVLPAQFVIQTQTNSRPQDNSYRITDGDGKVHYQRTFDQANKIFRDTIMLGYGCYTFEFKDEGGNGLSFWNPPVEGAGTLRFLTYPNLQALKTFNSDFGSGVTFRFKGGTPVGVDEQQAGYTTEITIFPQPASEKVYVKVEGKYPKSSALYDLSGKEARVFTAAETESGTLDVQGLASGLYILKWESTDGSIVTRKLTVSR